MTVVIGTAGHIDHGKTTLLRALTGIDADRLPEERRRGMTIDVGYAHLTLPSGETLDFVDVPGHDRLVGNMLVGAGEIDAALLVVAADDGPRAQTIEHLALLDALGIGDGVAVVTKTDVAGPERTAEVVGAVGRLLDGTSLAGSRVVAVSSVSGEGLDALRAALADLGERAAVRAAGPMAAAASAASAAPASAAAPAAAGARLAIDRVFGVKGRGVVVTGTLRGGSLARGATLRLVPGDRPVRVREIQVHNATVEAAGPGRTALNLAGVEAADLHRGVVLTDDVSVVASDRLLVRLAAALPDRGRARIHLGTAAADATVGRSGRDAIDLPDGTSVAIVRVAAPIAVATGDRVVLRRTSGAERIVGAVVLDPLPARGISRRRQTTERVARLAAAVADEGAPAIEAARLDLHGALLQPGPGPLRIAPDIEIAVESDLLAAVDPALDLPAARAAAAASLRRRATIDRTTAATAGAALLDRLVLAGRLIRHGATIGRPGSGPLTPAPAADPARDAAKDRLERALAVVAPPPLAETARASGCPPDAVRELERDGRIVVLEPDLAYAASTYRQLATTAIAAAGRGPLTPAALRDATGSSRKYVMAILADLDRRGILRRTPDGHLPGPRAHAGIDLGSATPTNAR
ncbi:MAG TPA: SelB C-terminal domain-containing protein [Candidatus Limnocylindrales bacterium]|nr:SelB C-terminal domain-containing protein [Candidatus Limnocylindrales bacterium]